MPEVDPVILQLKADVASYRADLAGAQRLTDSKLSAIEARGFAMGQNIRKGFDLAKAAAVGFLATLGVEALVSAARQGLEYASSLGEVAQQLGVTTGALQEYRYAATQVGLSQEEMDQSLSQLTRRIGEAANGTKAQAQAFDKLGISVKDANGNIVATGDAIPMIADALAKIHSPAERAAILMDLFGRAGQKLEPLLAGGSAAVNQLRDAAQRLGIVLSDQQIQNADDTADKLAALKTVLSARIAGVVADNAGSILALANALASVADWAARAANAYRKFMLEAKVRMADNAQNGWASGMIYSPQQLADFRRQGIDAQRELNVMSGGGLKSARTIMGGNLKLGGSAASAGTHVSAAPPKVKASGGGAGPTGPSADEIAHRFDAERAQLAQQALSAQQSMTKSADERAELELRSVELARVRMLADLASNKEYSSAQRDILRAQVEEVAQTERDRVEFERRRQSETDAADIADERHKAERDALQQQYDLASTEEDRRAVALKILDAEEAYLRAKLDAVISSKTASDIERQRAQVARDAMDAASPGEHRKVAQEHANPLERYAKSFNDPMTDVQNLVVDELQSVRDSIHSAVEKFTGTKDPLINGLISLLIDQVVMKPLAQALSGAGGGGGGGLAGLIGGSLLGGLFGRASGGPVMGGQLYRVNEAAGAGRAEAFMPQGSGKIIPLGRMDALAGSGSGPKVFNITVDARNSVTPSGFAQELSTHILRQAQAMDAQTARAVVKAVPSRVQQYQRDGY